MLIEVECADRPVFLGVLNKEFGATLVCVTVVRFWLILNAAFFTFIFKTCYIVSFFGCR